MIKKLVALLFVLSTIAFALTACASTGSTSSGATQTGNEVHMKGATFAQTSVTIQRGESLTLVADDSMPHIIANGTWQNGTATVAREAGAPEINNVQINGNSSQTLGPFNTSGTFQLHCTIHQGMNLTIIVQ
jgi:plastocyanin